MGFFLAPFPARKLFHNRYIVINSYCRIQESVAPCKGNQVNNTSECKFFSSKNLYLSILI